MGKSYGSNLEQPYEGSESDISTSKDYVDLQGNVPPFEYQVILGITERKTALKILAKQLQITSGDPQYGQLRDKVLELGVVPQDLGYDPTYDINKARKWYGLSEYVPSVESPDPEEAKESEETILHEMTWQKPRNEKNGEPDPKQQPGHIRLTNNEFNNELTPGKGDKESSRDPSTYIIPTFGRLLSIPEGDDKGTLEYNLRVAIEENDRNIPAELQRGELTPEDISIWRQKIGLETLSSEQTEPSRDEALANILNEYFPEDKPGSQGEETTSEVSAEQGIGQDEILPTSETSPSGLYVETETLLEKLPGAEALKQELNDLANSIVNQENGGESPRIAGEIYPGEGELETLDKSAEIEQLKQEAREAIQRYKEFGDRHAPNLRTESVQNVYRQLEKLAWDKVEELSHKLDGHLSRKLPQLRDILTAHRDLTNISDAKDSLVSTENIKLNTDGNITHIIDEEGNEVELNRPRTFEEIFDKPRPVRVLYNIDNKNKKLGYIVEGLNLNTPDWIEGVLSDKKFLESSIIVDPWDTPIEYILPNTEEESPLYPIDKTPKLTPAEELPKVRVEEAIGDTSTQDEKLQTNSKRQLNNLRTAYARAEELYNRNRSDEVAKSELTRLREEYNQEVENILMIKVAEGLESEIHRVFTQEVKNLRDERIVQSQELQSGFEKAINPLKEKFVNFAIKHKKIISRLNLVAFGVGTTLALTGFGLPVAGGLAVLRRSVSSLMSGVSSRELARAGFEDGSIKINKFGLNINFQAAIPKLVGESLQEAYIKGANDADLSTKLSTLEAYYRLNGGKFTNASQQEAYEAILNELGTRVQRESIANQAEKEELPVNINKSDEGEIKAQPDKFVFSSPEYNQQYTSRLLTTLSKERITELQKQQQKRKTADIIGFATGGTLLTIGSLLDAHRASVASKPDTLNPLEQPSGTSQPSIETTTPSATNPSIPEGTGGAATQNLSPEQLQDISELSPGETVYGEVSKLLGPNATDSQIKEIMYRYASTDLGTKSLYEAAVGTEGGKGLLSEWSVKNAQGFRGLSRDQFDQIAHYLAPGELKGLNLNTIMLSQFENAPNSLTLVDSVNGTKPLSLIDNYIAQYARDLPGSGSLGKLVLEEYVLETNEGKAWLYDAIQNRQAPNSPLAFELQQAKELFSREGIKAPADLEKLLVDRNGNPSAQLFWEKLSRVLKPGPMPGIKKALQLVLAKQ